MVTKSKKRNTEPFQALLSRSQLAAMIQLCRGEEGKWYRAKLAEIARTFETMHKVYEQDGLGHNAIVHLHYFKNGCDWYITERDTSVEQHQAFGAANLGDGAELGYISIAEIIAAGAELDLHWTPKTLKEALAQ